MRKLHTDGLPLGFVYLNAWLLARSQYAPGRSCDQFNWTKAFRDFHWCLEQMLSWYTESTLHCMLLMHPAPKLTSRFFSLSKCSPSNAIKISSPRCSPNTKFNPNSHLLSSSACNSTLPRILSSSLPYVLPAFTRRTSRDWLGTFRDVNVSGTFPVIISLVRLVAPPPPPILLFFFSPPLSLSACW
jgi:hypothetical protein